jgi:hypothetical protein
MFATVEEAIADIRSGKIVVVVDDADRENEGDFVMAAEKVSPETVNLMATHGRGLICVPIVGERLDQLGLPPISIGPDEGKILDLLARSCGARRAVEIGTLGGYSACWIARALPAGGTLDTIEYEPRHARVARENTGARSRVILETKSPASAFSATASLTALPLPIR